jgi:lysozyme family protein
MAIFEIALSKTLKHEGLYSNDKNDFGGETFRGISRRYHPMWEGWKIIDKLTSHTQLSGRLKKHADLNMAVSKFYQEHFWHPLCAEQINSQKIANEIFDTAVNLGVTRAVIFLQRALNLLNNNGKRWGNIITDGKIGIKTLHKIAICSHKKDYINDLLKIMNILQGAYYIKRMQLNETQEKFARGWLNRVSIRK